MAVRHLVLCAATLAAAAPPARAQSATGARPAPAAPRVTIDTIAPGVVHEERFIPDGPWRVHVVRADLRGGRYRLLAVRPGNALRGRERPSDMARRLEAAGHDVVAGINGDFFDMKNGENENNQVVDGQVLKALPVTDSPWDTFRNPHTQFAVGADGRPYFERFTFAGTVERAGSDGRPLVLRLDGVNEVPRQPDALVLFTAARDAAPRGDTIPGGVEVRLARLPDAPARAANGTGAAATEPAAGDALPLGGTARFTVVGAPGAIGRDRLGAGAATLAAFGAARPRLDSLLTGKGPITVRLRFDPDRGPLSLVVGGWPRLLVRGTSVAAGADSLEGTFPRFSAHRYARSAVGISPDSATLLLVTVDGPPEGTTGGSSVGMTLVELANLMRSLGAADALALDGGGSSTLLAGDRVVNVPSDRTGERAVGISLFVVRRF
ncbi:MAG: phosphodiester glycosidase family protein [Gemmatimonadetes bacterium]|nr:phosphodiester glycosidase family protein [Gemmatimonadota bacterium]